MIDSVTINMESNTIKSGYLSDSLSDRIPEALYLKDPGSSELGRRIISVGIDMVYEIGFEHFTFLKLARKLETSEASVYRYFENKHKLLLYLIAWYWAWTDRRLEFALANRSSASEKLRTALQVLTQNVAEDSNFTHINEIRLHRVVIEESSKTYLSKEVDDDNKAGAFSQYKLVVSKLSELITEMNPRYRYPHMLVSTVIEGAHHQRFFADHLPSLTDRSDKEDAVTKFFVHLVYQTIGIQL